MTNPPVMRGAQSQTTTAKLSPLVWQPGSSGQVYVGKKPCSIANTWRFSAWWVEICGRSRGTTEGDPRIL
jgi:hypothetical protein